MAVVVLEGDTLGEKHSHFNKLAKEIIANNNILELEDFNSGEHDVDKLLKIDKANHDRNVEYILEVLKCEDMLYVSRAIKRSNWLITDPQYENIINPNYLRMQLFPHMTTKAIHKFMLHIRLHLKNEKRVEEFFIEETNMKSAVKWLPNCSVAFIEKQVEEHTKFINANLLTRICIKSFKIVEIVFKKSFDSQTLNATKYLLQVDVDRYLDILEQTKQVYFRCDIGPKWTKLLMKKSYDRIVTKFEFYYMLINLPTFARYIKKDEVKTFLYKQVRNKHIFLNFKNIVHLIKAMPEKERFPFVNDVFINKIHTENDTDINTEPGVMRELCHKVQNQPTYKFYELAPFDIAFEEIKKLIRETIKKSYESQEMLIVVLKCAGNNSQNIHALLEYYRDAHYNDKETTFLDKILSKTDFSDYNENIWNTLEDIYKNLGVYNETNTSYNNFVASIIIYKVLHGFEVPNILENRICVTEFVQYKRKLKINEKNKIFDYLYNLIYTQIENNNITNESEFKNSVKLLKLLFTLLVHWDKELTDYPWVINKFKEYFKMRKENSWNTDLASFYHIKTSWKKHMFEESLELHPCEKVCINVLKHGPHLLTRNESAVDALRRNDGVSLARLLSKLRIYYPDTLASKWTEWYLDRFDESDGHKALIRGTCALLPRQQLLDIIQKYAPKESKVDWDNIDEVELSLQRHIAKNMHCARPQPVPDAIICYAKGDYLQYALPSLLAIFHNLSCQRTNDYIHKLLNAPVSVLKHGIRFAFLKLKHDELLQIFHETWKTMKNPSIRTIVFKFTSKLLCKETDTTKIETIWALLKQFIDMLTFEENKTIYELLTKNHVAKVPLIVRAEYLIKSHSFLKRLVANGKVEEDADYNKHIMELIGYTREITEHLPPNFLETELMECLEERFYKSKIDDNILMAFSAYLFCTKDESIQNERYKNTLLPLLERSHALWNERPEKENIVRKNLKTLLQILCCDLKYIVNKTFVIPLKMFSHIQHELTKLPMKENYIMLTKWKLTVEITKILEKHHPNDVGLWCSICSNVAQEIGKTCLRCLKEDIQEHFPCIYLLFARALDQVLDDLFKDECMRLEIYKEMIADQQFIPGYLIVINSYPYKDHKKRAEEIREILLSHPSVEVKMHYYRKFPQEAY